MVTVKERIKIINVTSSIKGSKYKILVCNKWKDKDVTQTQLQWASGGVGVHMFPTMIAISTMFNQHIY
jgi:hypothetical protein